MLCNRIGPVFVTLLLVIPALAQNSAAAKAPATEQQPRLELSATEFNFGEIWESMPAKGAITIRNVGQAPMTIQAHSTCGCTVISSPKSPLGPGESTELDISYDTTRVGITKKRIRILTNDPAQPEAGVDVVGTVKAVFDVKPQRIVSFKNLEPDSAATETLTLTNQYTSPVHLRIDESQPLTPYVAQLRELEPGQKYELKVTTKPPLDYGSNVMRLVLKTDLDKVPAVFLNMNAYIPPRLSVLPSKIVITPDTKSPRLRIIRLQYRKDDPLKVVEIKADPDSITAALRKAEPIANGEKTEAYEIEIHFPEPDTLPPNGAKLTILTDDEPPYDKVEVPIYVRLNSQSAQTPAIHKAP